MTSSYNRKMLAELLSGALQKRGIRQTDLAKEMGLKQQAVSKWMTGETRPRPDMVPALAAALGLDQIEVMAAAGYLEHTLIKEPHHGSGEPTRPSGFDAETGIPWERLSEEDKAEIRGFVRGLVSRRGRPNER